MSNDQRSAAEIEAEITRLDDEREEIEFALADIRAQLDDQTQEQADDWRRKASAALRYRGIDHQNILREIGQLRRVLKQTYHIESQEKRTFTMQFVAIAKATLPAESFAQIRDAAIAALDATCVVSRAPQ